MFLEGIVGWKRLNGGCSGLFCGVLRVFCALSGVFCLWFGVVEGEIDIEQAMNWIDQPQESFITTDDC